MTALTVPGAKPENTTGNNHETLVTNSLKQILEKLNDQDGIKEICELETHAHFRSGEERSPPIN